MASKSKLPPRLQREKLAFSYSSALEVGDFDTLSSILDAAVHDKVLAEMLREIDEVYARELEQSFRPGQFLIDPPLRSRRQFRPVYWIALAASVALIVVAFLGLRPDDSGETASGLLTPVVSPATMPVPTLTLTATEEPEAAVTETPVTPLLPEVTIPPIVIPGFDIQIPTISVPGIVIPTVAIHIPEVVVTVDVNPWADQP